MSDAQRQQSARLPTDLNPRTDAPLDFPERDLTEMTPQDYEALGFMCGLEVHQQLLTASKLFCRCPSGHSVRTFDAEVLRHMRPTLSELGEYDGTALMEFKTRKDIVYRLERGTVCTYEMDDTPPFELDDEAIRIALDLCTMFNLNLVSELHVMRKQYLDGSIPTGFQRTIMMGLDGEIPFRVPELGVDKKLRIRQLSLEEDSCREVSDIGHRITFRTDRLGMPLTEVVTEPDLLTPWEVQAGGRLVAHATRATGRVRRGPGTARQDVNVSIAGGRRVEIKGVHHHRGLPRLVHVEAFRQLNLLRIREELRRRGVSHESLLIPGGVPWDVSPLVVDATAILKRSDYAPLRETLEAAGGRARGREPRRSEARERSSEGIACAVRLPGFAGILGRPTQPGLTFANELADRVRVIACLTARPFLIHSDIRGYGLRNTEWRQLRQALRADRGDSIVVVWGPREDCATAARELFLRAAEALDGIPSETRQAYRDGTNGFERILPGPDRMYPDTDTPPLPVPDAWIEQARVQLPERPWERATRYRALGMGELEAARLVAAPWADYFDEVTSAAERLPAAVVRRLFYALEKQLPAVLRRQTGSRRGDAYAGAYSGVAARVAGTGVASEPETAPESRAAAELFPPPQTLAALVRAIVADELRLESMDLAVAQALAEPDVDADQLIESFRARADDGQVAVERVQRCAREATVLFGRGTEKDAIVRWAMGEVMAAVRGRVGAADVRALVQEALHPAATSKAAKKS